MKNMVSAPVMPVVSSIAPLAEDIDAWLLDIWGVMHNGVRPFDAAVAACEMFRGRGGTVLLLSNAPRPAPSVVEQLRRIGVADAAYDGVLSSGDAARAMIAGLSGEGILHIGPERDLPLFEGLGVERVGMNEASAVVCTGLRDDETETPDDYAPVLASAVERRLAMICANPDLKVERGGKLIWCAGGVAAAYERLGGEVEYAGKPHAPIYVLARERIAALRGKPVADDRLLAIGDGIKTDIAGASAAGIRSVFVASGVHVSDARAISQETLASLFPNPAARPIAAMTALAW